MNGTNGYPSYQRISKGHLSKAEPRRNPPCSAAFMAYQDECSVLFGPSPSIMLASESKDPLFHEAAVFVPGKTQDQFFVTSSRFMPDGDDQPTIRISKLTRSGADAFSWKCEQIPKCHSLMGNGGVNYPSTNSILLCAQGAPGHPGCLVMMDIEPPHATHKLLTSFHGRQFNSLNDVVVAQDGAIWFTDPSYGHEQGFRPAPELPSQLYRYDPVREDLRAVADGFIKPNGLCFSPDEQTMYVTDTAWICGTGETDDTRPSHIYAFNVETIHGAPFLTNRRLFAMADTGIPDGIKCDGQGNVYSGCGDGVSIWAPSGVLLGKILVPGGVANFCFGRPGELLLLNETRFWVARVSQNVRGALLDGMGVSVD